METLAAKDQENFVHGLQTQAASKPLNARLAPKTPFKVPLNDENALGRALHTKGKAPLTVKTDAKLENAFVTPAGPRTRAPLGMKTTNAKATAFQTPAPLSASVKTQKVSPRLRRPKVKVQPDVQIADEDHVPDVEYMPPKEIPLLDDYDYLPRDWKIPKLENGGVWEAYHNPLEDDGRTKLQRQFDEALDRDRKKRDEEFERKFQAQMDREQAETARHFGVALPKKTAPKSTAAKDDAKMKMKRAGPPTLAARSAAALLAEPRKPAYAAPTAATKSRLPSKTTLSKKPDVAGIATRHAQAAAASKSTIGYAQGRETAPSRALARKPISNVTKPAPFSVAASRPTQASSSLNHSRNIGTSSTAAKPRVMRTFSRSSSTSTNATLVAAPPQEEPEDRTAEDVERELELLLLRDDDEADEEAWAESFKNQLGGGDPFDEDLEDFQLQLPEAL
ncbi:hypothetical protein BU23DRAFT_488450 [Bimuria novae-zelandiae CBS 107.79]|uniref:Uncharacterized protein n=1 Tax=Bimuria novae-zelandiae CBS 107.79 TaxID=1447943 RepID=A0A6A5UM41_9PLEO|nr:hypothetical protein BU23DRAFT_488450 [Bimuria novae-zelandiae CBS 107.79]